MVAAASTEGGDADSKPSQNDVPVLRRAAMDYLARREHSEFELLQKLSKRFSEADAEVLRGVIGTLAGENLQSDDRFAENYSRYRKTRGFGYLHIKADLISRHVSESVIDKYLHPDDSAWSEILNNHVCKRAGDKQTLLFGSKPHKKLVRFLESRGFASIDIRRALEKRLSFPLSHSDS